MADSADKSQSPVPTAALQARSILLYGGTFDPPHRAHVELPTTARDQLGIDLLLYVPASVSPFKQDVASTPAPHRLAMLELALQDKPRTAIWTIEIDQGGVQYTVDTMTRLWEQVGGSTELYLLIGSDQAREFHRWRQARRVFELCSPAVMLRPPDTREALRDALREHWSEAEVKRWLCAVVDVPELDISATELRERLEQGDDVSDAVSRAVLEYIGDHWLYREEWRSR